LYEAVTLLGQRDLINIITSISRTSIAKCVFT